MMWNRYEPTRGLFTSPPLGGRGRNARSSAFRGRGRFRESELRKRAPHPDPLPARAGRGSRRVRKRGEVKKASARRFHRDVLERRFASAFTAAQVRRGGRVAEGARLESV